MIRDNNDKSVNITVFLVATGACTAQGRSTRRHAYSRSSKPVAEHTIPYMDMQSRGERASTVRICILYSLSLCWQSGVRLVVMIVVGQSYNKGLCLIRLCFLSSQSLHQFIMNVIIHIMKCNFSLGVIIHFEKFLMKFEMITLI